MISFRNLFYCVVGLCIAAAFLNVVTVHIWAKSTGSRSTVATVTYDVDKSTMSTTSNDALIAEEKNLPTVLWWADSQHYSSSIKKCGDVSCFFTSNRSYLNHPSTQMIMFYGTSIEFHDLPLPRKAHHQWAVVHEESPKNMWALSNEKFMTLFNYTATFQRTSDFPLTLLWLQSIEAIQSQKYYHTVEEKNRFMKELDLAPIAYIQSDCGAPSDRDHLVQLLSKHIKIDCLGKCLNNKQLPKHLQDNLSGMDHGDFYGLLSKYKFVMAAENAVCDDYITEKLWRSFYVGTVPIIYGSPSIKDFLPCSDSAVLVNDFQSVKSLASFIKKIDSNTSLYSHYTRYKTQGVSNSVLSNTFKNQKFSPMGVDDGRPNFISASQCGACHRLHYPRKSTGSKHIKCPMPVEFSMENPDILLSKPNDYFAQEYIYRQYQSEALVTYLQKYGKWTYLDLYNNAYMRLAKDRPEFISQRIISNFKRYAEENEM